MLIRLVATTALVSLSLQSAATVQAFAQQQVETNISAKAEPDIVALQYFARTGQRERFNKELSRIQKSFPNYNPAFESFIDDVEFDQELWTLYGKQELEQLEAEIAKRKALAPFWKPDAGMLEKIELAKSRVSIVEAFDRNDFQRVIELVGVNSALLNQNSLEVIWMAGTALARENQEDAAFEMFEFGIETGKASPQFPVLIQKAARYLPYAESSRFMRQIDIDAMQKEKAEEINERYHRGVILRSADMMIDFPPNLKDGVEQFGLNAVAKQRNDDIELLGWTFFGLEQYEAASRWFDGLPPNAVSPILIQGKILSLKNADNLSQALYLANRWKELSPTLTSIYINLNAEIVRAPQSISLDQNFLSQYKTLTLENKNPEGAEALGWFEVNSGSKLDDTDWFALAPEWRNEDPGAERLVEGKILSLKNTGRIEEARSLALKWRANSPKYARLYVDLHLPVIAGNDATKTTEEFIKSFVEAATLGKSTTGAEALAWFNLNRGKDKEAELWFDRSINWSKEKNERTAKLHEGKILALKNAGKLKEARVLANLWRDSLREIAVLYIDLNSSILLNPKVKKQEKDFINAYAEVTNRYRSAQGAEALGWYFVNTKQAKNADKWFDRALKWKSNQDRADATKFMEGRINAYQAAGNLKQARRLAAENAGLSSTIAKQYVVLYAELLSSAKGRKRSRAFLDRYKKITNRYRIEAGAQAIAWYSHHRRQYKTADVWFDRAIGWKETEAAVFGKTLNTFKRGQKKRFAALKKRYSKRYKTVARLDFGTTQKRKKSKKQVPSRYHQLVNGMVQANRRGQYKKCDALGAQLVKAKLAKGKDHELRGWCQLNRKSYKAANASFSRAIKLGGISKSNARYGLGLAALNQGRFNQAAKVAKSLPQKRRNTLLKDILARQALRAFENKRYRETIAILDRRRQFGRENRGLREIRGWSLYNSNKAVSALKVFRALDNEVSTRKTRRAVNIASEYRFRNLAQ